MITVHKRCLQIYLQTTWSWSSLLMLQRFQACDSWRSVCRDALSTDFRCSCLLCQGPVLPNCWSSRPFPYRKQTKQHTAWNNSWCRKNAIVTFKQSILLTVSRNNAILNACIFPNMHFGLAVTFYYHNHIILHMPWSCGCPRHVSAHFKNLSLTGCVGQFAKSSYQRGRVPTARCTMLK